MKTNVIFNPVAIGLLSTIAVALDSERITNNFHKANRHVRNQTLFFLNSSIASVSKNTNRISRNIGEKMKHHLFLIDIQHLIDSTLKVNITQIS